MIKEIPASMENRSSFSIDRQTENPRLSFDLMIGDSEKAKVNRRRKLLKKVFGKTSRSPFSWSLPLKGDTVTKFVQQQHKGFWSEKKNAPMRQFDYSKVNSSWHAVIALAAYHPEVLIDLDCDLTAKKPGLAYQLHSVELPIWSQLNSGQDLPCLLYTSPSPRDRQKSRMPSSA